MKNDMEYSAAQEYTALPDEYLQGGGNAQPAKKNGKAAWKKMMYMTAALVVMAYTAAGAFESSGTPNLPQTVNPSPATVDELPYYPVEDGTSFLTVYNDSIDRDTLDNRVLMQDFVFESLLLQGFTYSMPQYEQVDGYVFMGWVVYYDKALSSGPLLGMVGDELTVQDVHYIKPEAESGGSRNIEIHAAWRHDGIGEYPYLLVLDANGGMIENESSQVYDAKSPLESEAYIYLCAYPTPVREGYTFAGWYTQPNGGTKTTRLFGMDFYEKNGDEYDWSRTKTITLYAGWVKD